MNNYIKSLANFLFNKIDEYMVEDIINMNSYADENKQLKKLEKEMKKIRSLITLDDYGIS